MLETSATGTAKVLFLMLEGSAGCLIDQDSDLEPLEEEPSTTRLRLVASMEVVGAPMNKTTEKSETLEIGTVKAL